MTVMKARITESKMARERYVELRRILEERRREILNEVQEKMRDVRAEGASGEGKGVLDAAETSEADIQDDIEFALIQMKSETLHKIEEALELAEQRERILSQRRAGGYLLDLN
jgi:RNA polymerase-binding transcription factor DksA